MAGADFPDRLVLWDIDGTLVESRPSRRDKHQKAVEALLGHEIEGLGGSAGKTDRQILEELLVRQQSANGLPIVDHALEILDRLTVEEIRDWPLAATANALPALRAVSAAGWRNGLLTGNTRLRARANLHSAGWWGEFDGGVGYFGDQATSRPQLVGQCAADLRTGATVLAVVIGDTPLDVSSARNSRLPVVAVATGPFARSRLEESLPDLVLDNLESGIEPLLAFLASWSRAANSRRREASQIAKG